MAVYYKMSENPSIKYHVQTDKSQCYTYDNYLPDEYSEYLFSECQKLTLLKNPPIKIFGKVCYQKRSVGFFSNVSQGYKYSGQMLKSQPLPPSLLNLMESVNESLETDFNGILINLYSDGNDSIGFHSDSEKDLAKNGEVASITLGQGRTFKIRSKSANIPEISLQTHDGQLLVMAGNFQKEFTHGIPAETHVDKPRYSLTFRRHLA